MCVYGGRGCAENKKRGKGKNGVEKAYNLYLEAKKVCVSRNRECKENKREGKEGFSVLEAKQKCGCLG